MLLHFMCDEYKLSYPFIETIFKLKTNSRINNF